jgi:cyclophilin family peptidyl-prolyl cis-trans isomerase
MIQGGGFDQNMNTKDNLKPIKGEFIGNKIDNKLEHKVGTISMARTNVADSATSQFFICVKDCEYLDGQYAAFGNAVDEETKNIAIEISKVRTGNVGYYSDVPKEPIFIEDIEISEIE